MAAPTVSAVTPSVGLAAGGDLVVVTGTGFYNGGVASAVSAVHVGGTLATAVNVTSDTSLTCRVPAHAVGVTDLTVTTPGGTSATGAPDKYTYGPTLATQVPGLDGAVVALTAATAGAQGDYFINDGATSLRVKNAAVADITVTVKGVVPCNQGFLHDLAVVVAAGTEETIGPFPVRFTNAQTKLTQVEYSSVTTVTVAAVRG